MNAASRLTLVLVLAAGLALGAGPADAQRGRGNGIGPDAAASMVRDRTGGRVLGVQRGGSAERPRYDVKVLLPGGRVRIVSVDARSGALAD